MEQFKPSPAFVISSWVALILGTSIYFIGLWNSQILGDGEKGYYVVVLLFGLYSVVSVQKTVRDRVEGLPVSNVYYSVSWISLLLCIALMGIGLWRAGFDIGIKGFFAMGFILTLFAGVAVQKNIRDMASVNKYLRDNDDAYSGDEEYGASSTSSFFSRRDNESDLS